MKINTGADLTTKEIFDQYATGEDKDFLKPCTYTVSEV